MSFVDPSDMDASSSVASSPTGLARPLADATEEHHHLYHFHDGSLAFELDSIHYRVHSSLLARHCGFASTWAEDLRDPSAAEISRADIDAFLSMIYVATYEYVDLSLSTESWTSILHLATRWKSEGLRNTAIRMLAFRLSPLDKLLLCREYDIPKWLAPACAALALRQAPLTMAEAEKLEKPDILRVFLAREAVSKGGVEATEEAISAWLAGFLSKSSSHVPPSPAVPARTEAKLYSVTTSPVHAEATLAPSSLLAQQTPSAAMAGAPPKTDDQRSISCEPSVYPSSRSEETAVASHAATPPRARVNTSKKFGEVSLAGSHRPAVNSEASTVQPQDNIVSRSAQGIELSTGATEQTVIVPNVPVGTPDEILMDAVNAIREERFDEALNSFTADNVKPIAYLSAPSLIARPGWRNPSLELTRRLQELLRTIMRRVVKNPGFMPRATQFVAALSTQPALTGVHFEVVLHDDLQSLSSTWAVFRAGGRPAVDRGGVMSDLHTTDRKIYQAQTSHARGFFRALVRLGVLPGSNKYVEMLVQSYPMVPNP